MKCFRYVRDFANLECRKRFLSWLTNPIGCAQASFCYNTATSPALALSTTQTPSITQEPALELSGSSIREQAQQRASEIGQKELEKL